MEKNIHVNCTFKQDKTSSSYEIYLMGTILEKLRKWAVVKTRCGVSFKNNQIYVNRAVIKGFILSMWAARLVWVVLIIVVYNDVLQDFEFIRQELWNIEMSYIGNEVVYRFLDASSAVGIRSPWHQVMIWVSPLPCYIFHPIAYELHTLQPMLSLLPFCKN